MRRLIALRVTPLFFALAQPTLRRDRRPVQGVKGFHKGVRQAALVKAEEFPRVAGVIRSFIGIDEKAAKEGEAFMARKQH